MAAVHNFTERPPLGILDRRERPVSRVAERDKHGPAAVAGEAKQVAGELHVGDARVPFWVRYSASPSFFAFALDEPFVTEIWQKGFDRLRQLSEAHLQEIRESVLKWAEQASKPTFAWAPLN